MSPTPGDDNDRDAPAPARDPRLEIPQVLREPANHPSTGPKKPSALGSSMGEVGIALAIGIDFLVMAAAGGGLGWLADRRFGWAPWGVLIGSGLGFAAGLIRLLHRLSKEDARSRAAGPPGRPTGGPNRPKN